VSTLTVRQAIDQLTKLLLDGDVRADAVLSVQLFYPDPREERGLAYLGGTIRLEQVGLHNHTWLPLRAVVLPEELDAGALARLTRLAREVETGGQEAE